MRIGLVSQWVRAAVEHPEGRATALRYAIGISVVQVGWVSRLALPAECGSLDASWCSPLLDLSVPLWAERTGMTSWHPHHIAERYGLFTIIVLGESVSAAAIGVQRGSADSGAHRRRSSRSPRPGSCCCSRLWWLYFLEPAGDGLATRRGLSFYLGLRTLLRVRVAGGRSVPASKSLWRRGADTGSRLSDTAVGYAIAIPVAVFLLHRCACCTHPWRRRHGLGHLGRREDR